VAYPGFSSRGRTLSLPFRLSPHFRRGFRSYNLGIFLKFNVRFVAFWRRICGYPVSTFVSAGGEGVTEQAVPLKYVTVAWIRCCSLLQLMLDLAWVVFEQQTNVASLIRKIMLHTHSLLMCERCQVMLVDDTGKVCRPFRHLVYNSSCFYCTTIQLGLGPVIEEVSPFFSVEKQLRTYSSS